MKNPYQQYLSKYSKEQLVEVLVHRRANEPELAFAAIAELKTRGLLAQHVDTFRCALDALTAQGLVPHEKQAHEKTSCGAPDELRKRGLEHDEGQTEEIRPPAARHQVVSSQQGKAIEPTEPNSTPRGTTMCDICGAPPSSSHITETFDNSAAELSGSSITVCQACFRLEEGRRRSRAKRFTCFFMPLGALGVWSLVSLSGKEITSPSEGLRLFYSVLALICSIAMPGWTWEAVHEFHVLRGIARELRRIRLSGGELEYLERLKCQARNLTFISVFFLGFTVLVNYLTLAGRMEFPASDPNDYVVYSRGNVRPASPAHLLPQNVSFLLITYVAFPFIGIFSGYAALKRFSKIQRLKQSAGTVRDP